MFFGFSLVAVVVLEDAWVARHMGVLATGTLAVLSWLSILTKHPFTLAYARSAVDKSQWDSPGLIRRSYLMTGVWASIFSVNVAVNIFKLYHGEISGWIYEAVQYAFIFLGILFTIYYPKWASRIK